MEHPRGHSHPLSLVIRRAADIFTSLGFAIAEGPEVELEKYNFDLLNIPADHPARDMWDTFWLKGRDAEENRRLLRTHTSPVQVRYMLAHKPPYALVVPGRVFRYEATDATHEAQFYQLEGLMVGSGISLAHLKGVLERFFGELFGTHAKVRMRPSYFPFVEPGVEVDVSCFKCEGYGCALCKGTGWIEIMGAGMVHASVLRGCGVDPAHWQGFAFGCGIDRIAMLMYGIDDIRLFYGGDLRFSAQF